MQNKFWGVIILSTLFLVIGCLDGGRSISRSRITARTSVDDGGIDSDASGDTIDTTGESLRPSNQIYIKADFCACINGLPDIINNCEAFCKTKTDKVPTLYGTVTAGPDVANNPALKDLYGWCNNELDDGLTNPGCKLEVTDNSITSEIDMTITGNNTFIANLNNLAKNKTYVLTIVESNSGSNARSKSFQILRKDFSSMNYRGPLKVVPVHQYSCISRASKTPPSGYPQTELSYEAAIKQFYYYPDGNTLLTMSPDQQLIFCHDISRYGEDDNPLYPRLELVPHSFYMWSEDDLRFYDNDGNGNLDINDEIQARLLNEYGIETTVNYFNQQAWEQYPSVSSSSSGSSSSSNNKSPALGYIMLYWLESDSNKSYCPDQSQFNSTDPSLRILKDYIVGGTEGVYLGAPQGNDAYDYNGEKVNDTGYILIREGLLKKIWFYFENGQHKLPDDTTAGSKSLMFYWPADTTYPHIKKASQRLYAIKSFQEAFGSGNSGPKTDYIAHDKRFGCVPKKGN